MARHEYPISRGGWDNPRSMDEHGIRAIAAENAALQQRFFGENAPLLVFATVGAVLTVFMLKS